MIARPMLADGGHHVVPVLVAFGRDDGLEEADDARGVVAQAVRAGEVWIARLVAGVEADVRLRLAGRLSCLRAGPKRSSRKAA